MTRRGRGEGSIRLRADGRWEARYTASDGRRRSLIGKTRGDVQTRLRAALTATENAIPAQDYRITVSAWLDEWLATSVEGRLRTRSAASYAQIVRLYIKPAIGRVPLAKLTPEHVSRMLAALAARGTLSSTTIRYVHTVTRAALGRALKSGRVTRNVATLIDIPGKERREFRPLTADQIGVFLDVAKDDRLAALYTMAIGTGLRQGELLALRWSDLDLAAGSLTVRHTLVRGTRELAEPKTERSRRTLHLGSEVMAAVRDHRRRQIEERIAAGPRWRDQDFVFATPLGDPLDTSNVLHAFQRALARAGLPRQRFHDLRHAHATLLIEQGEDLGVVSKALGHSTIGTTADVYAHLTPAMTRRVADRLDLVLRRSEGVS